MNKRTNLLLGSCLSLALAHTAATQETIPPPPKVLVIAREYLKPGKGGALHEKAESAFVQASIRAKSQTHYLAVNALSGRPRALFLFGYDSFDAWEKDNRAVEKNPALSAALERAAVADGELLSDADGSVLVYNEEYSLRSAVDIPHMRYFETTLIRVRPGREGEFDAAVKLFKAAWEKVPGAAWAAYHVQYGLEGNTYVFFTPLKSAAEIDRILGLDKQFMANMGEDGMKKFSELTSQTIETIQVNLFSFNPRMSYVSPEWIKADPDFWKPKASPAVAAKKPAEKPAESH